MDIRDAIEADAERLATLTGAPTDVMRNLVHDRTVRVAHEADDVRGFVSYDAQEKTIHVTQLEGDPELCERLLEEPTRFAAGENMEVELLVTEADESAQTAVERAGFEEHGPGPSFDGTRTTRYRWTPD
ncbi:MAG: hypothetical protein ACI8UR_000607 [Natronomonas sp.]|jgi:hypothetical protein|uniref:hypothetical protein n=1 Tax=Natronomonas sp. TaxID=2184060 RepID=UPI003989A51E